MRRDLAADELERRLDDAELRYERAMERVATLEQAVRDLQSGVAWWPDARARRIATTRTGGSVLGGTVEFRGGARQGVVVGAVAVTKDRAQLIGLVSQVGPLVSTVRLLTDTRVEREARYIGAVITAPAAPGDALARSTKELQLERAEGGIFVAEDVGVGPGEDALVAAGLVVRLRDEAWPPIAQMLVLGVIERVEETDNPQFRRVIVRPAVDIGRVQSAILHIPDDDLSGSSTGEGGSP